ncbi:MAG TPA: thioredoxin family protein [Saprospiraceae bacterium]|nr:thioredoxin family protein [Saprospiraceae bacterium]
MDKLTHQIIYLIIIILGISCTHQPVKTSNISVELDNKDVNRLYVFKTYNLEDCIDTLFPDKNGIFKKNYDNIGELVFISDTNIFDYLYYLPTILESGDIHFSLKEKSNRYQSSGKLNNTMRDIYFKIMDGNTSEDYIITKIIENKSNVIAPFLASTRLLGHKKLMEIVQAIDSSVLFNTYYGRSIVNLKYPPKKLGQYDFLDTLGMRKSLDLDGYEYAYLDFWATWCTPCLEEMRKIKFDRIFFEDRGVKLISISTDREFLKWKEFISNKEFLWDHYNFKDEINKPDIQNDIGITSIPHGVLINKEGDILLNFVKSYREIDKYLQNRPKL